MQKTLAIIIALFAGLFQPKPIDIVPQPQPVKIIFAGDLSFDRHIRQKANENSYEFILAPLKKLFSEADLVVVNLETPITDNPSVSLGSIPGEPRNFSFTSAPETATVLADHNIRVVNLGNNHILNFGQEGLTQTKNYLVQAEVDYFTSGQPMIKTINQLNIGLVNYNQFVSGNLTAVLEDLRILRPQVDVLIVFSHWGEEYQPFAGPAIQVLAHQFIEAGADLVIGTHPHVIQQKEIYQGQEIYYSLGNFVFDQYFSPETRRGMLIEAVIDPENLTSFTTKELYVDILPTGQTVLVQ